jgi:spore coat protein A, manganese oxidase
MRLSRRGFLGTLGVSALGAVSFGALALPGSAGQTGELLRSKAKLPEPFQVPLPIPPVARPVRTDASADYYAITQRAASVEILPGLRTPILGYDGTFPGPTVISRTGRRTVVNHRNELRTPTVVHLHGGHTPADSDGYPTRLVPPAAAFDYDYPNRQRAATLWYHDHTMDLTGPQVYRGLAGFHLIHDEEDALPLPKGERDIPLMIVDRAFEEDGSFRYPGMNSGALGDVILVNGAPWPVLEVDAARYRLRILNASNARRYQLRLDPATPLTQIGSDGGLLDHPVTHDALVIAPGERFDIVVDFSGHAPGTAITVLNGLGSGTAAHVMRFRVTRRSSDDSTVPPELAKVERLEVSRAVRTRTWHFTRGELGDHKGWLVNGNPFDPNRIDASVRLGDTEIWRFMTDLHHPIHVHLNQFQIISRRGHTPALTDSGWKDTVDLTPTEYVEVAIRFTDYPGRYLIHCHNLEHEDMSMMSAFQVVE